MRLEHTAPARHHTTRVLALVATTLLVGFFATALGTGTAHAAAYRFWGFYQWKSSAWSLANVGPGAVTPKDGAVEGWRLAVSGEKSPPRVPRAAGDFTQLCGTTDPVSGKKRIAVVIDYGIAGEGDDPKPPPAARGACAVVDTKASSAQVLAAVASVRESKSLICAIDSFPATGCGDPVAKAPDVASPEPTVTLVLPVAATPADKPTKKAGTATHDSTAAASDDSAGFPVWQVVGAAVVVGLVVGGFMMRRRRATDQDG